MAHHDLAGLTVKYKNFIANNDAVLRMKKKEQGGKGAAGIHPSQHLLKLVISWPQIA